MCRDFDKLGGGNTADTPEWAARWAAITAANLQVWFATLSDASRAAPARDSLYMLPLYQRCNLCNHPRAPASTILFTSVRLLEHLTHPRP